MWYIKYLSGTMLLMAIGTMSVSSASGQRYYHSPGDTIAASIPPDDVSVFNIIQRHTGSDTLHFSWQRQQVILPASWKASICDNLNCYTTLKDSGMMAPVVPGDVGLLSLHIDPGYTSGTAVIRYVVSEVSTPHQEDTLTWIITAGSTTAIPEQDRTSPQVFIADYRLQCHNLRGQYTSVALFDLYGRKLYQQEVSGNDLSIDTRLFGSQVLIIRLDGKKHLIRKIFNH